MIFEGLDGSLGGIDTVFVGRNELPFDVMSVEVFCDGVGSFIVEDIKLRFESFWVEIQEDVIKYGFTQKDIEIQPLKDIEIDVANFMV